MASSRELNNLFSNAMKGQWDEVLRIYKKSQEAQKAKITILEDTVLHIAVSSGQTETAIELISISENSILEVENARGNTTLHIAAALGNLVVCTSMIEKNPNLTAIRNHYGETPVFLAALNGKKDTFLYLYSKDKEESLVRRNNGDTILHAAISGLAMCIINSHPDLADAINENVSLMHFAVVLASISSIESYTIALSWMSLRRKHLILKHILQRKQEEEQNLLIILKTTRLA
ncbi:hypothetical protein F8388_026572 [Cannabis sativa]|uniref:Ankyrin repeat-containing protein n=1 Tax=Cannabis sativa TaxID=3483 RepID=A0A7J6EAE9_CANSA|nr:hypothetical protein F8388_026572 [Cannabis sativa]